MFGGLPHKLSAWAEAGLISQDQSAGILLFEKERKGTKLTRDLTNVGLFAILLGLLSVIASNWELIPPQGQLGLHALLNIGVAALIWRFEAKDKPYKRDMAVTFLFGLFLTFIALIAQIYQLHGDLYQTLAVWLAICTPFIWIWGKSYLAVLPWLSALVVTLFLNAERWADFDQGWLFLVLAFAVYLPLFLLAAARVPWLKINRPDYVDAFQSLGFFLPAASATLATFSFNESNRVTGHHSLLLGLMTIGILLTCLLFRPRKNDERSFDLFLYMAVSGILIMLPFGLLSVHSGALAAVLFIAYWIYMAWLGARLHVRRLTDWAIRFVILRLFIVYFEVFGSLMLNGLSMILGGVLLVLVIKYREKLMSYGRKLVRYEI